MDAVHTLYGIDFSGAQDAGNKIWIAKGVPEGERLLISECYRARDLTESGKGIDECLQALVNWVRSETRAWQLRREQSC
jgi:hypothetical protein